MKDKDTMRPGDTFRLHGKLCHFVGTLQDEGVTLYVYWRWNKYSQSRVYVTQPGCLFDIDLMYAV